jgi:hypothetical protein
MVIAQQPTQSLPASHRPFAVGGCSPGEQQDVALALMIALGMIMLNVFVQGTTQGALAEEDYFGQALLLHGPDPQRSAYAFRFGLRAGNASDSTRPDAMMARNDWVYFASRSCRR